MNTHTNKTEYTIDATGKRLGKVAVEAARILNGKNSVSYAKNVVPAVTVRIEHAAKLDIPEGKERDTYERYSGYPSGRTVERLDHLAARRGYKEVLTRSITGMLPKNRLQKQKLKNLIITE